MHENTEYGRIKLREGFLFVWARTKDGEVSGHVETPEGAIVKGSYGWWRTNEPSKAASLAEWLYAIVKPTEG